LLALATLAWGIDNNLSQRLSLRNPIQIATWKAAGASLPMLALALLLGHTLPSLPICLGLLAIGALGYGISIWLDLLALRDLGAAREAVLFSTAPFVGALFSLVILREQHSHRHRHKVLLHAHRHLHDPHGGDSHHDHLHSPEDVADIHVDAPFWHAHEQ
jgi:drug/metabolite transporter (DMT)-like permease